MSALPLRLLLLLVGVGVGVVSLGACKHSEPEPATPAVEAAPPAAAAAAPSAPTADGWWRDAVFYEIFVRSFYDTDGDGVGDLRGVTAKLDYLADLGVDALWLMPIQPSPSYHGYDVTDYRGINPDYGTLADFDALLAAAHARGIRVITDLVLNHSSSRHPWFLESRTGPTSPKRSWYSWRAEEPTGWARPWDGASVWHSLGDSFFYAIFWDGMPDLNLAHPPVRAEMLDVMRFWLARGLDGFRVDAARYLFESADGKNADLDASKAFIRDARTHVRDVAPDALFVAEAWTGAGDVAPYYGAGDLYQLAFAFDTASALLTSVQGGSRSELNQAVIAAERLFEDRSFLAPFLTNHDMKRAMRQLGGDWGAMRVAAGVLMALPGTPFLYYGEEIGMMGGDGNQDEHKRTPMRWTSEAPGHGFTTAAAPWHPAPKEPADINVVGQRADPQSLWHLYRALITLRGDSAALRRGTTQRVRITGGGRGAFALLREHAGERVLAIFNLGETPLAPVTFDVQGAPTVLLTEGTVPAPVGTDSGLRLEQMGPRSFAYVSLK